MFSGPVTGIDYRNPAGAGKLFYRAGNRMTHGNNITIAADDPCGVIQGLSLGDLSGFADLTTQQVECAAKTDPGAGAGFEKEIAKDSAIKDAGVHFALCVRF